MFELIVLCVVSYLLGSIPTSVWVGKWFYGIDIREHGSGNAGATNTFRVLGAKAAVPVFLFDVAKGFMMPFVSVYFIESFPNDPYLYKIIIGIFAVVGHIFPLFANFKGGKGVATLLGMTLGISPLPSLLAFSVFIIVFMIFRYVSLGSLTAAVFFPFFIYFFSNDSLSLWIFAVVAIVLLFYTHRSNIKRLINGTENKISFRKRN
ncbi:MAG: glycerol-3-phosphate 1-O-acyltransferase PlsY [Bacteroidales bacterium]|nr:glycerol-3-phosphate 1-O-acyltransferase PlsY [Bacteroidales bacterium]